MWRIKSTDGEVWIHNAEENQDNIKQHGNISDEGNSSDVKLGPL